MLELARRRASAAGADLRAHRRGGARRSARRSTRCTRRYTAQRGRAGGDRRRAEPEDHSAMPTRPPTPAAYIAAPPRLHCPTKPSAAGPAQLTDDGGFRFERDGARREGGRTSSTARCIGSADARKLDQHAPSSCRRSMRKPARLRRKDDETAIHGPIEPVRGRLRRRPQGHHACSATRAWAK